MEFPPYFFLFQGHLIAENPGNAPARHQTYTFNQHTQYNYFTKKKISQCAHDLFATLLAVSLPPCPIIATPSRLAPLELAPRNVLRPLSLSEDLEQPAKYDVSCTVCTVFAVSASGAQSFFGFRLSDSE